MENNYNSSLILENPERTENELRVFPDKTNIDLVGFIVKHEDKELAMCNEDINGDGQEYFYLDKFQVRILIDYLKRLYEIME